MRSMTKKLSLAGLAVLLAHCAAPVQDSETGSESAISSDGQSDDRTGLASLHDFSGSRRVRTTPAEEAIAYATAAAEAAGAVAPQFEVTSQAQDVDGLIHVRLQQMHDGMVVWGADQVVHISPSRVVGMAGSIAKDLTTARSVGGVDPRSFLAKAKEDRYPGLEITTDREQAERIIHVDPNGVSRVAVHTSFFNELQRGAEPALWNHVFDAQTGEVLAMWNEIQHAVHFDGETPDQASGPGGNPKYVHSWNGELDVAPKAEGTFVMTTPRLKTLNLNNTSSGGSEVVGALDPIGDAPINDAHGFAEVTLNMMQEWMGRNSINDNGFQIVSRVHYGRNYENAFWDGRQMTYGDGANRFYPLSGAVDVVAHEINHGYTAFHSKLAYRGEPGAFNEGFSDIAGKTAEFFYKENPNFDLGGDVFKAPNAALRYMCNPRQDGRSIDHVSQMRPSTDPHYSSGVPNKVFCVATKRFSSGAPDGAATKEGVKRVAQAFYLANGQYWTASTTFVQGCQGVMDAARALNFTEEELTHLKTSWADVGVTCN